MEIVRTAKMNNTKRQPVWTDIAGRFPEDRDCLAAFLAFEAAEVLAGAKPAALINLPDRQRSCGKNFYSIWKEHGQDLISESYLEGTVLVERSGSLLLFLYDREALCRLLEDKKALAMLRKAGYATELDLDSLLSELSSRFGSGVVPHEIGIVLGYPLKDVAGFMGISRRQYSCQGPWKIYGNPKESLRLAETHRQYRSRMAGWLLSGWGPYHCLGSSNRSAGMPRTGLFYHANENESHYRIGGLAA